ncbi:hypothetical protein ABZ348_19455 [Streptomyces sp. NPDC005963]|uniref:hypothetical protein n=1 Tax=Streptomyces sp. NPDC005963 TaxID=3156721 RepID=UPI0033E30927
MVRTSKIRKSSVLSVAAATLAGPLLLAGPAQAAPVAITCTTNTTASGVTPSCTRDVSDGDAGGVSGAVRITANSGEYARIAFQADGEKVVMQNTWRSWKAVFELYTHSSSGWSKKATWKVSTAVTSNLSIPEGVPVYIKVCMEGGGFGCAGNNRLIA